MNRRNFIRFSALSAGTSLIIPNALAETAQPTEISSDIYYTKSSPGRWASKVGTHLPTVEVSKVNDKASIKVVTPHEMKDYEHYIVKHVLLDKQHKFLDEHLFNPLVDKVPLSTFTLENYTGTIYILSLCNKHDLWLAAAEI